MTDEKLCIPRPETEWAFCLPEYYPCELKEDRLVITEYLIKLAKEEGGPTTYEETSGIIGLNPNNRVLFTHLGALSWVTHRNEDAFLSVLVARKDEKVPGDGFFKLVAGLREIPYKASTDDEVFINEIKRVYQFAKEGKFDFMLTGKTLK